MSDALTDIGSTPPNADGSTEPGLKRTLGGFQVFAISFAFISVAVGIFGTYDAVLQGSGPVGIWLWILVAVGQILVALVYAQFAGRIALSGTSYQWASLLATPKIGYAFGWMTAFLLAIDADRRRQRPGQHGADAAVRHGARRAGGPVPHRRRCSWSRW